MNFSKNQFLNRNFSLLLETVTVPYFTRDNGYQLYYYHNGNDTWPIIFIHGYLGSSKTHWGNQLNDSKLSSHFQLIAPDLRGYAKSSVGKLVEKHQTLDHILDLQFLINHLKLQQKPVLVGYSIGGTLALMYAVKYPQSVQGILLVSPRPFLHKFTRSWNFLTKEKRSGENRSTLSSLIWVIIKRIQKLMSFVAIKRQMKRSQGYFQGLEQIDSPILMLYGTKDTVNPSIAYDVLKEHLPQAEVIELECDHGIPHERSEEFNQICYEFLVQNTSD